MNWIQSHTITLVLPLVLGILSKKGVDLLKGVIVALDKASPTVKQATAVALSFLLAGVAHWIGAYLPTACLGSSPDGSACLTALTDPSALSVLLGGLIAIAMKHSEQIDAAKP